MILNSTLGVVSQVISPGSTAGTNSLHVMRWLQVSDVNLDGKLDLIIGKNNNSGHQFLLGNNSGTFAVQEKLVMEVSTPGPYKNNSRCKIWDLNLDFMPDTICNSEGAYGVGVMINSSY